MSVTPPPRAEVLFWAEPLLGNPLWGWLLALGVALAVFTAGLFARALLAGRARRLMESRPSHATRLLSRLTSSVSPLSLLVVGVALGAVQLALPDKAEHALRIAVTVALSVQAVLWGRHVIEGVLERLLERRVGPDGKPDPALLTALAPMRLIALGVMVTLVVLIALDNAGVNITALIAGLGIGGIAIALAVQSVLSDLFAAVSIVLDKPFMVGDFIVVGDKMGTVEAIGLKTTRVRALSGEQLVFANSDLLASRIQNFKRMQERRVVFLFGVTYQTPAPLLRQVPRIVREAVEHNSPTRFDRCHFKRFADSALEFEAVYFVGVPDFNTYMDIQQAVNLELFERLQAAGVDFAYPTQTVYEYKMPPPAWAARPSAPDDGGGENLGGRRAPSMAGARQDGAPGAE